MSKQEATEGSAKKVTAEEVTRYLQQYPDFFLEHPEVLQSLIPPALQGGENISDFQSFAIRRLQDQIRELQKKLDGLVDSARDNNSALHQIHHAILGIIKAKDLEQLLEVITLDLVQLFQVDVVRLALESNASELHESYYPEHHYSGIVFIDVETTDEIFHGRSNVMLSSDTSKDYIPAFDQIFSECTRIVQSCALLRLDFKQEELPPAILAIGVRDKGRFHPGQGTELLQFLALILQDRLETCLDQVDLS